MDESVGLWEEIVPLLTVARNCGKPGKDPPVLLLIKGSISRVCVGL